MTEEQFKLLMASTQPDQESALIFTTKLLKDWMRKNTIEGMSIQQSVWVFSRFEEFTVVINGQTRKVDIFKMFSSGAIPTLFYCLLKVQPDPMTEPYHWVTQERINWVLNELETWLGPSVSGYIRTLP